ncbi:IS256 family transposase [Methylomonas fluvii]|uniref:Mutator family transposase n=2 Tax=Methylomonas fluvii TaxID=1854564 RepID=A0ABR9DFR2_9GAMM|nr:IS256 family transposase [Methylomonas fluvii]MBD9361932.1 IS256 family transposase [Methylomonas fluvii]
MSKDNAKEWDSASALNDPLTDLLKMGAKALIQQAVEAELQAFLGEYAKVTDLRGRQTVVRNGYLPEREIVTGVGNVTVKIPKVRDRSGGGVKFNSSLVPPYVRKAKRVEAALPWLYLRGISTGDMQDALSVLLGTEAKGLSPAVVSRLKAQWAEDYQAWHRRDLSNQRYVYVWADGIYSTLRGEDDRLCLLVIIGVNEHGEKRLLALSDGYRESKASWLSVLQDLQTRGLQDAPKLATGDGALGFWAAVNETWPQTRTQRCWVHKTANVLAALPDSIQAKAKAGLKNIWLAETKDHASKAFDSFRRDFEAKYPKAVNILEKDRESLLAFYDFPAEHWVHIRTTNPIESSFATIRHRTTRTKNCVSRHSLLGLVFQLALTAEKSWRKIRGFKQLPDVINGIRFQDGIAVITESDKAAENQQIAA